MFDTPINFLYIILAISAIILTIFISWAIIYLIFILREIQQTTSHVKKTADRINNWLIEPAKIANEIFQKVKYVSRFIENRSRRKGKK